MTIRFVRQFLLALIVIGIGLLVTYKLWVPSLVAAILAHDPIEKSQSTEILEGSNAPNTTAQLPNYKPVATTTTQSATTSVTPLPTRNGTGKITGSISLSPTCPVERDPPDPDPDCAPRAYLTRVDAVRNGTDAVVTSVQSGSDGTYVFALAPGVYRIRAGEGKLYPRCTEMTVTVLDAKTTQADISCDTGIR